VKCTPPSGSTFAVGTTTVTCTATDADDTNSPVTASFTVTVGIGLPGGGGGGGGGGSTPPTSFALSVSPGSGGPGTHINVASLTPCPAGTVGGTVSLRDATGRVIATAAMSFNGFSWTATLTVPRGASAQMASVDAACLGGGGTAVAVYGAAPFTITGASHHHHRGHHHNHRHRHHP
jgi:hypothetical protein